MENVVGYINSNREKYVKELEDFLRIPSISTSAANKSDMLTAAEFVSSKLREAGMENVKIIETKGHPLIYADWLHTARKTNSVGLRTLRCSTC